MKNLLYICTLLLILIQGMTCHAQLMYDKAIITGKIENYDPEVSLNLTMHRLGLSSITIYPKVEVDGHFYAEVDVHIPTEVWVSYKTNFRVMMCPKDSLHVSFDGGTNRRSDLLATVQFGGTDAITNMHMAQYGRMYYTNELFDQAINRRKVKEYNPTEYMSYNDTVRQKARELYEQFVLTYTPNDKSKKWALFESESIYYRNILFYATDHKEANNIGFMDTTFVVPEGFYEKLTMRLPIDEGNLMNTYTLGTFSDFFKPFIYEKLKPLRPEEANWIISPSGNLFAQSNVWDDLNLNGMVDFVPDPTLKEIMISLYFSRKFAKQDVTAYEEVNSLIQKCWKLNYKMKTSPLSISVWTQT